MNQRTWTNHSSRQNFPREKNFDGTGRLPSPWTDLLGPLEGVVHHAIGNPFEGIWIVIPHCPVSFIGLAKYIAKSTTFELVGHLRDHGREGQLEENVATGLVLPEVGTTVYIVQRGLALGRLVLLVLPELFSPIKTV